MDWQPESPALWAFLESLHCGDILSGAVAAIERFGVFVALDDGPDHPALPGVGFIDIAELSRGHSAPTDVVEVGQRVSCEFLQWKSSGQRAGCSSPGRKAVGKQVSCRTGPPPAPASKGAQGLQQRPHPRVPSAPRYPAYHPGEDRQPGLAPV
ncbi:S1 RNA-binding domain-containing protein [Streptomyces sp. NPDC059352]|uniref:S1 RNA-binding domain-containing protein n=1 Tax=Streptomyces sp. NPDC059352 TaxID=3346810 RepID=UPI0036AB92EC